MLSAQGCPGLNGKTLEQDPIYSLQGHLIYELSPAVVAAVVTQLAAHYTWNEGLGMWSLSLPQLAATLAAALTAFQTQNAAGERLIDETVMSAVIVLMVVTATLGPILTQRFAQRIAPHS